MVHSTLWRKSQKSAWALILLLLNYNLAFSEYGIGLYIKEKNDNYDLNINTEKKYDPNTGRIIGNRQINEVTQKDVSDLKFYYVSWSKNNFRLSISNRYQAIDYSNDFYGFVYGIGVRRISYLEKLQISKINLSFDCIVACSFINTLANREEDNFQEAKVKTLNNPYILIGYKYTYFNKKYSILADQKSAINILFEIDY